MDLIESCLDNIYKARKAQLMARTRKYNRKLAQQSNRVHSPQKKALKKYTLNVDGDDDIDDEVMIKQLTSKFIAPPVAPIDYSNSSSKANDLSDIEPQIIFEQFYADFEAATSVEQGASNMAEEQVEEICNSLIEKYLSNGLDLVPQTQEVCLIKQSISKMIEEFATAVLSHGVEKVPKKKDSDGMTLQNRQSQKEEMERDKIRKQYESYLKIKKRNDDHPDHSRIKDYESLNSDIKAVLDSMNGKGK